MSEFAIRIKNTPTDSSPWFAIMVDAYKDNIVVGTGAYAETRDEAIELCKVKFEAMRDAEPVEEIPYSPVQR